MEVYIAPTSAPSAGMEPTTNSLEELGRHEYSIKQKLYFQYVQLLCLNQGLFLQYLHSPKSFSQSALLLSYFIEIVDSNPVEIANVQQKTTVLRSFLPNLVTIMSLRLFVCRESHE